MPKDSRATVGAKNSYDRALAQYREDIRRDYVTGVYNSRFIHEEYRSYAEKQASRGIPVGAVRCASMNTGNCGTGSRWKLPSAA